jgi:hypothetical protein
LISNVNFRVEYQRSELTIFQKDQDLSRSLNLLSELALQNNDRKYLDYTGRQLANIVIAETAPPLRVDSTNSSLADFSCSLILQILKKQEVLEFTDRNSVYLKSWYEISCSSFD